MLRNIPSAALKELIKLSERKEALMASIQEIDREMVRVQKRYGIPTRNDDQIAPVTISRAPVRRSAVSRRLRAKQKIARA